MRCAWHHLREEVYHTMTLAFAVVFGVFVVALVVLVVLIVRWALNRDRAARERQSGGDLS
ncbi:MAG: hypothetical protein ACYCTL_12225 [Acidimicrobiales bacterium]